MIEAYRYRSGPRHALLVQGHSGYAPRGSDVVCAGVSALCAALASTLDRLEKKREISSLDYRISEGCFYCSFDDGGRGEGSGAFECACAGIGLISECYPACAAISESPVLPVKGKR